jgi:hypothetical protein
MKLLQAETMKWEERKIFMDTDRWKKVLTNVIGFLGIHNCINGPFYPPKYYAVSHMPTGRCLFAVVYVGPGNFGKLQKAVEEINTKYDFDFSDHKDFPQHIKGGGRDLATMVRMINRHRLKVIEF